MSEQIQDLIQHALNQDYNKAGQVFGDVMGEKIVDALDQEKIAIANQIYNGGEPEEDIEFDEEDFEDFDEEEFDEEDEEDLEEE